MSKTDKPKRKKFVMEERIGSIKILKRYAFSQIPEELMDLQYTYKDQPKHVFSLLQWAKNNAKLFDDDEVVFITVTELQGTWHRGNFVLLHENEHFYTKNDKKVDKVFEGCKIIMNNHPNFGWQPKRKVKFPLPSWDPQLKEDILDG